MMGWALAWHLLAAHEQPQPRPPTPIVELRWSAPPPCPDAAAVEALIVELVGRPLAEDPQRVLRVDGTIATSDGRYVLELQLEDASGSVTRRFDAARCDEVVEAGAVVVAIAVDPGADVKRPRDAIPEAPQPPPAVVAGPRPDTTPRDVAPTLPPPPVRMRPHRPRLRLVLAIAGGIDGGHLPAARGAIEASAGVLLRRARVEGGAIHLFAREVPGGTRPGGSFRTTAARVRGCWEPHLRRFSIPVCGGVELGTIYGRGVHVMRSSDARKLWLALSAGAGLTWSPVSRLALTVRGELVVGPLRRGFTLADAPLVDTGAVGGRALAGLEVRLP